MAVAPQFAGHRIGSADSKHTLELYLDYDCPFSAKQARGVYNDLLPLLKPGQCSIVLRQYPQPWHAPSTLMHEAAIAVAHLNPSKFWDFSMALFNAQDDYSEEKAKDLTIGQMRDMLANLAAKSVGLDKAAVLDQLAVGSGNGGSKVTADLKLVVKIGRQNSIHVTPTVLLDGLVDPAVSSSFGKDEWQKYVSEKLA